MNRCGCFPLFSTPHSRFNIWTNLKRFEKIPGAPTRRWGEWIWLTRPSGLHRNSPQGLNITISVPSGFLTRSEIRKSQSPFTTLLKLKLWCFKIHKLIKVDKPIVWRIILRALYSYFRILYFGQLYFISLQSWGMLSSHKLLFHAYSGENTLPTDGCLL